jgi:hypothetical protein
MAKKKTKLNLKKTTTKEEKEETNIFESLLTKNPLYYSGFCLTDNLTFAFFYAEEKKLVDNSLIKDLNRFKFNEAELDIILDRTTKIEFSKGIKKVHFPNYGFINREIFNTMQEIYPECVFHPVLTFFGQDVNSMLIVLSEEYGKPVGLFKPI